ncbi:MAG: OmpA family protein [Cytophagales bacterium]|nr:OmpA family protein [Cytophagales bacterium]
MKHYIFTACIMLLGLTFAAAQDGNSYFENKDYYNAARYYESEVRNDASKYLNLSKSYFALKEFDKAISAMEKYKDEYSGADIIYARKYIELLKRQDEDIELRSIDNINTDKLEYYPVVSKDGSRLYFTGSDRDDGKGGEDLFYTNRLDDGNWGNPINFDVLNTTTHEGLLGINADQDVVILFGNYPGSFGGGDLFYSVKEEETWTFPCNLGGSVNTDDWEAQASLSGSGKYLLFVSDRAGGKGGTDLYMTTIGSEGWSVPINLSGINTPEGEYSPYLAADDETLYFSSSGYFSFGSQDLFVTRRLDDTWENWSEPINMGKEINTLDSDRYLAIPSSGTRGYIGAYDQTSITKNRNIYEFILPPSLRPETFINVKGTVVNEKAKGVPVIIRYYDHETKEEVGLTVSDENDGSYALSLPAYKRYDVIVDMKGYLYYDTDLDLNDLSKYYPIRSFEEIVGDKFAQLQTSESNYKAFNRSFNVHLSATTEGDMLQNFDDFIKLTDSYDLESEKVRQLLREAKYAYLLELENQRTITQDHEVQAIEVGASFNVDNLFFDFGKATLREESKTELNHLYDIMEKSEIVIEFGGHTDNVGSDEANQQLSQARVNSVRNYLIEKGINGQRIDAVGYGETLPVASNETEEGRQKNRRVELKITSLRLQREGQDEITGDEDISALKEDLGALALIKEEIDLKSLFKEAAQKGGLPDGSDCGRSIDELYTDGNVVVRDEDDDDGSAGLNLKMGGNAEKLDKSNYIFKGFNAHVQNFGFENSDQGSLGVGARLMNDKLRELYGNFYLVNPDGISGMANVGILYAIQLYDIVNLPINFHFGGDALAYAPEQGDSPEKPDPQWFVNVPVGLRYVHSFNDLKVGPELFYHINVLKSDGITDTPGHFRLGVNARWKLFHGGLFLNSGKFVNYAGFRAGISL